MDTPLAEHSDPPETCEDAELGAQIMVLCCCHVSRAILPSTYALFITSFYCVNFSSFIFIQICLKLNLDYSMLGVNGRITVVCLSEEKT